MKSKITLANLPTPILKLNKLSKSLGKNIYIKRDDQTGTELSGNKIRKLEYSLAEAKELGCDTVVTCGGIQSNHCRATTVAANTVGLKTILLLRDCGDLKLEGNFLIDKLFGAEIVLCTPEEYKNSRKEIMEGIVKERAKNGSKVYIIPEGASNPIGSLGYIDCMAEIAEQERHMGVIFDTIVVAVGSGGTYSGLHAANIHYKMGKRICGFAVCDDSLYFTNIVKEISKESLSLIGQDYSSQEISRGIEIIDRYKGIGYALNTTEELEFISKIAKEESIILDPVYTGKAMRGLEGEIRSGGMDSASNILFIHTGGLFGLFPKHHEFSFL